MARHSRTTGAIRRVKSIDRGGDSRKSARAHLDSCYANTCKRASFGLRGVRRFAFPSIRENLLMHSLSLHSLILELFNKERALDLISSIHNSGRGLARRAATFCTRGPFLASVARAAGRPRARGGRARACTRSPGRPRALRHKLESPDDAPGPVGARLRRTGNARGKLS